MAYATTQCTTVQNARYCHVNSSSIFLKFLYEIYKKRISWTQSTKRTQALLKERQIIFIENIRSLSYSQELWQWMYQAVLDPKHAKIQMKKEFGRGSTTKQVLISSHFLLSWHRRSQEHKQLPLRSRKVTVQVVRLLYFFTRSDFLMPVGHTWRYDNLAKI